MKKELKTIEEDLVSLTLMFVKHLFKYCVRNINNPDRHDLGHGDWNKNDIRNWLYEQQEWCLSKQGEFWFHTWEEITTMSWDKIRMAFLRLIDKKLIENEATEIRRI